VADSLLHKFNDVSDVTVRLFNGDVPSMLGRAINQDWATVANAVFALCNQLYSGLSLFIPEPVLTQLATGISAVGSVAQKIGQISSDRSTLPVPSNIRVGDAQLTGEGGLALEVLNYASTLTLNQTDILSWNNAGQKCRTLSAQLLGVVWSGSFYCPVVGSETQTCTWDFTGPATEIFHRLNQFCIALVYAGTLSNVN